MSQPDADQPMLSSRDTLVAEDPKSRELYHSTIASMETNK